MGTSTTKELNADIKLESTIKQESEIVNTEEDEVPPKKIKLDETINNENQQEEDEITEISLLEGTDKQKSISKSLLDPIKGPTLRQLQYANGIIKVIRENVSITGLHTLIQMVSKEIKQPPMDTKALRRFLNKLVIDGQLRIYKLNWPGFKNKNTILICDRHVKKNDPTVTNAFKEISMRAYTYRKCPVNVKSRDKFDTKLYSHTYPKYMKVKKLHEFLFDVIYNNESIIDTDLPPGFGSIVNVVPEMSIELAVGHVSAKKLYEIENVKKSDIVSNKKLKDCPQHVYRSLLLSKSFWSALKTNLELLSAMGLVQVCFKTDLIMDYHSGFQKYLFYINRRAKIVNTKGIWPRNDIDVTNLEKHYYFETTDDVKKYWDDVYNICVNTKVKRTSKNRSLPKIHTRNCNEVQDYDTGTIFGDGFGPGGFHSACYLEIQQLWHMQSILHSKKKIAPKVINRTIKRKIKRVQKKVPKKITPAKKLSDLRPITKVRNREVQVKWSKLEDDIILMVRVAMTIMSHILRPGCMQVMNTVAKDIISIFNIYKTPLQCYKRYKILQKDQSFVHEKQRLLNEMRRRHATLINYDEIIGKLKYKHSSNLTKYINEARLRCMELVWVIQQIYKGTAYNSTIPCVALSLDEFNMNFNITLPVSSKPFSLYATSTDDPIEVATLKEGITLTVNFGLFSEIDINVSMKIYAIFKEYPEKNLRIAIEQLHRSGAISIREKSFNIQLQKSPCCDILQYSSIYKPSAVYQRRWNNRLNTDFTDNLISLLNSFETTNNIKGTPEVCCFLCELLAINAIKIFTTVKPTVTGSSMHEDSMSVTDLEIKHYFKSGYVGWQNVNHDKKIASIYQDIDYKAALSSVMR